MGDERAARAEGTGVKFVRRNDMSYRAPHLMGLIGRPKDTANVLIRIRVRSYAIVILHKRSSLVSGETVVQRIGFHTASDYNAV